MLGFLYILFLTETNVLYHAEIMRGTTENCCSDIIVSKYLPEQRPEPIALHSAIFYY
jgi:hypothetical protein